MRSLIVFFLIIFVVSCNNKGRIYNSSEATFISPLRNLHKINKENEFSKYISDIQYFGINSNSHNIYGIDKVLLLNDDMKIISSKNGVFLFDSTWTCQIKYGGKGKGPGEYSNRKSICLSSDQKSICILDQSDNILQYSVSNGFFIGSLNLKWSNNPPITDMCPAFPDGFYVFQPHAFDLNNYNNEFYCFKRLDQNGKVKSMFIERKDFNFTFNVFYQNDENKYLIRPIEGTNIIYQIDDKYVTPKYVIEFGNRYIPERHIYSYGPDPWINIPQYIYSDYYKLIMDVYETNDCLYFRCAGYQAITENFLYFKKNSSSINWANYPELAFTMMNSYGGYFYTVLEGDCLIDNCLDDMDLLQKYLVENIPDSLKSREDPIVVKIKFLYPIQ